MINMSAQTKNRLRRTILQSLAGGILTGVLVSLVSSDFRALGVALATAGGTVLATWAQNAAEDAAKLKDRRAH